MRIGARRALDRDARAGQLVQRLTVALERRVHRRHLQRVAEESGQHAQDRSRARAAGTGVVSTTSPSASPVAVRAPSAIRKRIASCRPPALRRRAWWPRRGRSAACRSPADRGCRRGPPCRGATGAARAAVAPLEDRPERLVEQQDPAGQAGLVVLVRGLVLADGRVDQVRQPVGALDAGVELELQLAARAAGPAGARPRRAGTRRRGSGRPALPRCECAPPKGTNRHADRAHVLQPRDTAVIVTAPTRGSRTSRGMQVRQHALQLGFDPQRARTLAGHQGCRRTIRRWRARLPRASSTRSGRPRARPGSSSRRCRTRCRRAPR